jgi:hypothetical protein
MAVYKTYDATGIREDLADIIYNISPTDTPFISNVGKGTTSGTYYEWQTDSLAAATDNKAIEGAAAASASADATERVGNYTQIATKTVSVSGSNEASDAAGRASEMAYQMAKKGLELKRDMEKTLVGTSKVMSAGSGSAARELGSLASWVATNKSQASDGGDDTGSGEANDGGTWGKGTGLPTDGTARAFSETLLTDVVEDIWEQGGNPSIIMCGAFQKSKITAFTGNATKYKDVTDKTIVNAVDVYVSDYGELTVVPNRLMETDKVYVLQPDMFSVDYYRDFQTTDLAKTGDSEEKQMLVEYTLCSKNEKASGVILDLTTS